MKANELRFDPQGDPIIYAVKSSKYQHKAFNYTCVDKILKHINYCENSTLWIRGNFENAYKKDFTDTENPIKLKEFKEVDFDALDSDAYFAKFYKITPTDLAKLLGCLFDLCNGLNDNGADWVQLYVENPDIDTATDEFYKSFISDYKKDKEPLFKISRLQVN